MRLFDAIIDANQRAVGGDQSAGIHLGDYAAELPVVAMTCIDPRLNRLFPGVMGLPAEGFIWLRNAGNVIYDPLSSMTRSLALACAMMGGREIVIIGHTDCRVCKTSMAELVEKFNNLGVARNRMPENLTEYFGTFSSERQNVIRSTEIVRKSPLIGPQVPVQGLMVDVVTGKLEWVVNGYEALQRSAAADPTVMKMPEIGSTLSATLDEIKFSETKIGEIATEAKKLAAEIRGAPAIPVPPPIPSGQSLRIKK